MRKIHLLAAASAISIVVPGIAAAQTGGIEEIVVTSRKREESLQEIPVSVSAFTADAIQRAGFTDLEDISKQTPGLQFNTNLSGTRPGRLFSNMRFRGIEGAGFSTTQTASLYIDGVFALQGAQSISLMDLERVEIIKGPQSAQFGRNSFAGAVNYITRTPNIDEFQGQIIAEGATYDQYELQASHEGPLVAGKLAYRVNARLYNKGAMWTANDGGDMGEQSTKAVSGQLYAQPNDDWTIKFRTFYQRDDDGPAAVAFLQGRLNDTCSGTTVTVAGVTRRPQNFLCGTVPSPGEARAPKVTANTNLNPQGAAWLANPNFLTRNLLNFNQVAKVPKLEGFGLERNMFRVSLTSDYTFQNGISASVTAAYNSNAANDLRDWDMTDLVTNNKWFVTNPQRGTDKSIDARVQSDDSDRFRWLVGGNVYRQKFRTSGNGGVFATECANFALAATEAGFCSTPGIFPTGLDANDFVKVWSIYASASYDITEQLTLDLEGRYLNDNRGDGTGFTKTYKQKLPRVTLSYQATEDINVYGNWSRGTLPGVINSNIINCQAQTYTQPFIDPRTGRPSTSSECQQYQEALGNAAIPLTPTQTLEAWEIGLKSTFLDGRALFNIAAYRYKWKNQPFSTFVTIYRDDNNDRIPNTNQNFFPVNASGSSKSKGIEAEAMFAPVDGWTIQGNISYNKNQFIVFNTLSAADSVTLGAGASDNVSLRGNRASRFPKWMGSVSSTYTANLMADWDWFGRADWIYNGRAVTGQINLATVKAWNLVNVRAGVEKDAVRFEFFVKNLFNTKRWSAGQDFTDFTVRFPPFDFNKSGIILLPQDKRTFGVKTALEF